MKYQISLWRDGLLSTEEFETKVLDIPNKSESPIGATTPTLTQNINGMKEFSFSLVRHYMDGGELEKNPLIEELVEESKIKVLVGEDWHDFIIKNISESKEGDRITYSCQDLASIELGKRGIEIVLNTELENNYGTVEDLAKRILKNSGYSLSEDSDKPYESKEEALYVMKLDGELTATRATDSTEVTLQQGDYIYLPYSSVDWDSDTRKWKKGSKYERKGYQILWRNGEPFKELDLQEGRIVYDPDFKNNLIIEELPNNEINLAGSQTDDSGSASIMKGRFLQESTVSAYEPIMDRIVEKVRVINSAAGKPVGTIVNKYTETEYWTSNIVQNLLLNAKNFTSTDMWETADGKIGKQYTIKPKTITGGRYSNVLTFPTVGSSFKNISLYKSGVKFFPGDRVVYAIKGRFMKPSATVANSSTTTLSKASVVTVGLQDEKSNTPIYSTVNWTPSAEIEYGLPGKGSKPKALTVGTSHVYNGYVYGIIEVKESMNTPEFLLNIGSTDTYAFTLEEVQLFKYNVRNGAMILPEDTPTAEAIVSNHYYTLEEGEEKRLAANDNWYEPVIRANYEAVRHIEVAQNSYFNNLNTLAEKFGMWVDFHYTRDERGAILEKYVSLYRFNPLQTTNWAGFKYGINLSNIQRNVNSTQITTKLIVADNANQFGTNGTTSIKRAKANTNGESSIWNFDFYLNKGLLDKDQLARDMYGYESQDGAFLTQVKNINKELQPLTNRLINMTADLAQAQAFIVVEKEKVSNSLKEIQRLTNLIDEYNEILDKHGSGGVTSQAVENAQKALDKAKGIYDDARKEQETLAGRITRYKYELHRGVDEFIGSVDSIQDVVGKAIYPGQYFVYNNQLRIATSTITENANLINWSSIINQAPLKLRQMALLEKKRALFNWFESKYHRYIAEGFWNDPSYLDDDEYYADAQVLSANNALPQVNYEVNIADLGLLEGHELYKFNVGESTFVEDIEFFGSTKQLVDDVVVETPYKKAVVIMESRQVLDDPSQSSIVVKTYKGTQQDLISRVSYGLNSLEKELNNQSSRISETEKLSADAKANRFLFENVLNNISNKVEQYSQDFALELANAPGVTLEWLNKNVKVLKGDVLATGSIRTDHFEAGVVEAISAEVSSLVAKVLIADTAFIDSLESVFGKFELINTGLIESADGKSWWNLDTGEINLSGDNVNVEIDEESIKTVVRTSVEGELSKKLDSLASGGYNLISNGKGNTVEGYLIWGPGSITSDGDKITVKRGADSGFSGAQTPPFKIEEGKTYTVAFDFWSDTELSILDYNYLMRPVGGNQSIDKINVSDTLKEHRYAISFTAPWDDELARVMIATRLDSGQEIYIKNIMITESTIPSSFGLSEEEIMTETTIAIKDIYDSALKDLSDSIDEQAGIIAEKATPENIEKAEKTLKELIENNTSTISQTAGNFTQQYEDIKVSIKDNRVEIDKLLGIIDSGIDDNGNVYTDWIGNDDNRVRVGSDGIQMLSSNTPTLTLKDGVGEMTSLYVENELGLGNHTARKMGTKFTVFITKGG